MARSELTEEGKLVYKEPRVEQVIERVMKVVEEEKQGRFMTDREKDQLTAALGNPEHSGRLRAVSSQMS